MKNGMQEQVQDFIKVAKANNKPYVIGPMFYMREKETHWLRDTLLVILFIIGMIVLWKISEPGQKAYNKHMCAVYGYYEDCKTPLREEDKLK